MRRFLFFVITLLFVVGCGSNNNDFVATNNNNQGSNSPGSGTIGTQGGTLFSADGSVSFRVEPGVFPVDTKVTLTTSAPYARSGPQLVSNICQLQLDPAPPDSLNPPPQLTFLQSQGDQSSLAPCQQRLIQGQSIPGSDPFPANFFMPGQSFFGFDGESHLQLELPLLKEQQVFCTASQVDVGQCQPSAQDLVPPPTPNGTVYIGTEVVVNGVYVPELSTVPIDRKHDPSDTLFVRSETRVVDNVTDCDIIVVHVFAQPGKETCECEIPPEMLVPPPTPAGYRPIGYTVVKNFVNVEDTTNLTRTPLESDITAIRSRTVVVNSVTECDIIVGFDFEQIIGGPSQTKQISIDSGGGVVDLDDAAPVCLLFPPGSLPQPTLVTLELVDPLLLDQTVLWPQVQITLDPQPPLPLQTPPILLFKNAQSLLDPFEICRLTEDPGSVDGSTDPYIRLLPQPTRGNEAGGISIPLPVPEGVFVVAKPKTCDIPASALAPPPTPVGQKYLGREVVCNFVYDTNLSTLPLDRGPAPTDQIFIVSETTVVNGVVCDYIVAHYFEPNVNDQQCIPPAGFLTPPPTPPGTQFVGFDFVLNFKLLDSTVAFNRVEKASDTNFIRSSTTVLGNGAICDFIVRFLYEPNN
jgi:hypothetical protein